MTEDVFLVSDFNVELPSRFLSADISAPNLTATAAPYGQLFQALTAPASIAPNLFVWTRPEGAAPSFGAALRGEAVAAEQIMSEVDTFASLIAARSTAYRTLLVATWSRTDSGRGAGLLDWTPSGAALLLARMNVRLAEQLQDFANVRLLDSQRWIDVAHPARDARFWYSMKFPFTTGVAQAAARDVKAAIRAFRGEAKKLVILDLDETLWGGVIGETGWQGIRLGGHDPVGEAYVDFQRALKELSVRGVALGVVSKNTEATAMEAFDCHPEMVLRRSDLAGWRINWNDKAQNVAELVRDLNLGLQSVVFIDDNPIERGRVAEDFPEVLVPEWPTDPARFAETLRQMDCFDQVATTNEDRERVRMYARERERGESQGVASSLEDWLRDLEVEVSVEAVDRLNAARVIQLLNKTNQMNLSTRRMTEAELSHWLEQGNGRRAYALKVRDRFGELGLTGVLSWELQGDRLQVVDFVLSCRAMGRKIENLMTHLAVEGARRRGVEVAVATFKPTPRNSPCREFWTSSGFQEIDSHTFVWNAQSAYPKPAFISANMDVELSSPL